MNKNGFSSILLLLTTSVISGLVATFYFLGIQNNKHKTKILPQPSIVSSVNKTDGAVNDTSSVSDEIPSNWQIYRSSDNVFTLEYPSDLYVKGEGEQVFLSKQRATDAEKLDYSDQLVEIRIGNFMDRFESYYNTRDKTVVTGYSDFKLRSYNINGYQVVEYGYDESDKQKELKHNEDALRSGSGVMMIYFRKGIIANRDGTTLEISTKAYKGDFKTIFDKILTTLNIQK